jgi:hypothetical protein
VRWSSTFTAKVKVRAVLGHSDEASLVSVLITRGERDDKRRDRKFEGGEMTCEVRWNEKARWREVASPRVSANFTRLYVSSVCSLRIYTMLVLSI